MTDEMSHPEKSLDQEDYKTVCDMDNVIVHFDNQTTNIKKDKLCKLGYFASSLSKRWCTTTPNNDISHVDCNSDCNIYITKNFSQDSKTDDIDDDTDDAFCVQLKLGFGMSDLELLIECIELGYIPSKLGSDCESIERLIACSDYFTSSQNKFQINKDAVLHYLQNRVPRISLKQIKELEKDAKNVILKSALKEWNDTIITMIQSFRNEVISNHDKIAADNIFLDSETANQLFIQTFKPKIVCQTQSNKFKVSIDGFKNKDYYMRLWKQCNYDENYSIISMLPNIVDTMLKHKNIDRLDTNGILGMDEYLVVRDITLGIVRDAYSGKIDISRLGIDMYSLTVSIMLKFVYGCSYFDKPYDEFVIKLKYFSLDNIHEFLSIILRNHGKYSDNYVYVTNDNVVNSNDIAPKKNKGMKQWYQLIRACLVRSDSKYIVETASQWFPILVGKGRNDVETKIKIKNIDWIFDVLTPILGAHDCLKFAIYLAKSIVLDRPKDSDHVSPKIFNFIENETGIKYTVKKHESQKTEK